MATLSSKKLRQQVYEKCGGHCGYCGKSIELKQLQVDHIQAKQRGWDEETALRVGIEKGTEDIENLMPACARCNRWKSTFTIEDFRWQIEQQTERLRRDKPGYNLALDFGLIQEDIKPVVFYFEQIQAKVIAA